MPNKRLTNEVRAVIMNNMSMHAHKMVKLMQMHFPLTVDEVEDTLWELPIEDLHTVQELYARGYRCITKNSDFRVALSPEFLPLRRGIVATFALPKSIFLSKPGELHGSIDANTVFSERSRLLRPKFERLTQAKREELALWFDKLLYQRRVYDIVRHCTQQLIQHENITPTVAHLMALWPMAGSMLNGASREWQEWFRNPPRRNLALYVPDHTLMNAFKAYLHVADTQLSQGLVMPQVDLPADAIKMSINWYQRLEGDRALPNA